VAMHHAQTGAQARHSNLNTTQRYIEADAECQRRVVELV